MNDILGENKTKYKKIDIAMQFLNLALSEYVKDQNMFAVIHLAGAAEELLGKIVILSGKEKNALRGDLQSMRNWYTIQKKDTPQDKEFNKIILHAKNAIKHIDLRKQDDLEVEICAKQEAKEIIRRAIQNYNLIQIIPYSDELLAYFEHDPF